MKRTIVSESWSLPVEVWTDILSRLPVKSLLLFRCVSKSWKSLIDDPSFCQLHLKKFVNNRDETHLFVTQSDQGYMEGEHCVVRCGNTFNTKARLDPIDTIYRDGQCLDVWNVPCSMDGLVMPCSMDGLVMVRPFRPTHTLIMWNPSIRKTRLLPPSPAIPEGLVSVDLDIGFDPLVNDYKLVRLALCVTDRCLHSVAIYTLGTGLWKTIPPEGKGCSNYCRWSVRPNDSWGRICFRGVLYFILWNGYSHANEHGVVWFDLSREVFDSIGYPADDILNPQSLAPGRLTLVDGGRLLGLVFLTQGSIWVLESCGADTDSKEWTKYSTFTFHSSIPRLYPSVGARPEYLFLKKNGDMIVRWDKMVTLHKSTSKVEKNNE